MTFARQLDNVAAPGVTGGGRLVTESLVDYHDEARAAMRQRLKDRWLRRVGKIGHQAHFADTLKQMCCTV